MLSGSTGFHDSFCVNYFSHMLYDLLYSMCCLVSKPVLQFSGNLWLFNIYITRSNRLPWGMREQWTIRIGKVGKARWYVKNLDLSHQNTSGRNDRLGNICEALDSKELIVGDGCLFLQVLTSIRFSISVTFANPLVKCCLRALSHVHACFVPMPLPSFSSSSLMPERHF